jgi:serine/threonine protein kinase
MSQFKVGDYIGGEFRVHQVMKGGMGAVYVVTHPRYGAPLILKTLQQNGDSGAEELFRQEAKAWIDVGLHPNLVEAFWVDRFSGVLYVAAEYIAPDDNECNTLDGHIASGRISHVSLLKWSAQFCYGMMYATKNGIRAHRDIKPGNLMIDSLGDLRITDFGLVKKTEWQSGRPLVTNIFDSSNDLATGSGTPAYMSPEQILAIPNLDARTDMYAFGVTLYECVMGRLPFIASSMNELLQMHMNKSPAPTGTVYDRIIFRCMRKNFEDRYQDFDELLYDIKSLAGHVGVNIPVQPGVVNAENERLYRKALSYSSLGRRHEAIEAAMQYCLRCKSDHRGWLQVGRLLYEEGDIEAALHYTDTALSLDPFNSYGWNNKGLILGTLGQFDLAITCFDKSIEYDPENAGAALNKANVLNDSGRSDEAIDLLESILRNYPSKASVWSNLGVIKLERHDFSGAINCFQSALKYDSTLEAASGGLRRASQRLDIEERIYEPDQLVMAIHDAVAGSDFEIAFQLLNKLNDFPEYKFSYMLLKCQVMQASGRGILAIKLLNEFLKANSEFDAGWYVLGEICLREGKADNAKVAFRNARNILLKNNPGSENLHHLEQMLARL